MQLVPENDTLQTSRIPGTPQTSKNHSTNDPPVVKITPLTQKYCAHAQDEVLKKAEVLNKFLEDDVNDRAVLTVDEFATLILDLPPNWKVEEEFSLQPESETVREAFEAYLRVAIGEADGEGKKRKGAAGHEKRLYKPLVNLLNTIRDGTGCVGKDIDEKIFYVQDPRPILGSLLDRKPDLGGIYIQLLKLAENQRLSEYLAENKIIGVFWGLLLFFIEVKHQRGNFIGLNISEEESRMSRNGSKSASQHGSNHVSKRAMARSDLTSSRSTPSKSKKRTTSGENDDIHKPPDVAGRPTKKAKLRQTTQPLRQSARLKARSSVIATGAGSSSRTQSKTLPSVGSVLRSNVASSPGSTTTGFEGEGGTARVTFHESGGKEKTVEVMTSQDYSLKAEAEIQAEQKLTPTQGQHHTRIQCASYAKEMLSNGFIRNHAMGIVADDSGFRFQYYDRSKVIESEAFHIIDDELKKLFMAMICQLNRLDSEKLGFIPNLDYDYLRNSKQFAYDLTDDPQGLVGACYSFKGSDGHVRTVEIVRVLYRAEGIVGRCSIVVEVKCVCSVTGCKWHGENKIMKISFPSKSRTSEDTLIREARTKAESSGEHWALNHLPDIIDSITITYHEKDTVQGRLKTHLKDQYEERVMRVTVLEPLHQLSELNNLRDLAQVFYDILQIHQWLYECAGILHRDLSIGNIMYRCEEGEVYGVLNDFDLSSRIQDLAKGPTSNQRTGTRPFMSPDLLDPLWKGGQLSRHDLESLFYIMLCLCCRYERPGVPADEPRAYAKWFSGNDDEVFAQKNAFITRFPQLSVQPYFGDFEQWLEPIRNCLVTGYQERLLLQIMKRSSTNAPCNFNWDTLNGNISYSNFRKVMSSFQHKPLETRWFEWNPDH